MTALPRLLVFFFFLLFLEPHEISTTIVSAGGRARRVGGCHSISGFLKVMEFRSGLGVSEPLE